MIYSMVDGILAPVPPGLQYSLPAVVTGMLQRGIPLTRTAKWWAGEPSHLAGLHGRKGHLAAGFDADIVV